MPRSVTRLKPLCKDAGCRECLIVETATKPKTRARKEAPIDFARFADMLSAMATEPRLRIMHLLLAAHPKGLVVGDIQSALDIAPSTLSHHLDKLRHEGLAKVRRERKFLWYTANTSGLEELLRFLFSECCTGSQAVNTDAIFRLCR